jgi:tetratricopeptide (TPR) repeat protein
MDVANFDWQREVAYGHHNLAVLDQGRGNNKEAEQALRSELALFHKWLAMHPNDAGLRSEAANAASFLGSLALTGGRLAEAQARFEEQLAGLTYNRKDEPDNATWKQDWINAQVLLAQAQAARGRVDDARRSVADANALAVMLTAQDPSNREWQAALGYCHWWQARLLTGTDPTRAAQEARVAQRLFAVGNAAEPNDKRFLVWLAKTRLLLAELDLQRGDATSARELAAQAREMLAPAWKREPAGDLRQMLARAHLLDGMAAQARDDHAAARVAWSLAERLLRDGLGEPPAFDRLELLVRVLQAQRRDADAAPYLARLDKSGYVPLPPWASNASLTATR